MSLGVRPSQRLQLILCNARTSVTAQDASGHCPFLIRSGHYAKTYSARHARGRRPRRSTRRPKALLPPRQTALVEAVHIFHIQVHIQDSGHVLLSWVVSTHEGLLLFYRFTQRDDICFLGGVATVEEMSICSLVMTSEGNSMGNLAAEQVTPATVNSTVRTREYL